MSEPKFTPGPWSVEDRYVGRMVGEIDTCIAECFDHSSIDRHNAKANACLIAAAPELYEALSRMIDIVNDSQGVVGYHLNGDIAEWDEFDDIEVALAALAKARNELMTPQEEE